MRWLNWKERLVLILKGAGIIAALYVTGRIVIEPWASVLVIAAIVPAYIADSKGHSMFWWWLFGLVVLPIALVAAIMAEDQFRRPCPYCAERIRLRAVVCPFCQRDIDPTAEPALTTAEV